MSPNDPRHGTNAGAIQHWRDGERACPACVIGKRRSAKAAELDRIRGEARTVTLGAAAHSIIANTPRDQLARATGLTVHKLVRLDAAGPDKPVHRRTRDRILAAGTLDYWTPVGIQRRLQALHAIGWSARALAPEIGNGHATTLLSLLHRERPQFVRRDFALRIIAAFDRLAMTPQEGAGATRARNLAIRNGWPAPLAWDNIDTDPEPHLSGADGMCIVAGCGNRAERRDWCLLCFKRLQSAAALPADAHDPVVDDVVVRRVLNGVPQPDATPAERAEAARRWVAAGGTHKAFERLTGWNLDRVLAVAARTEVA